MEVRHKHPEREVRPHGPLLPGAGPIVLGHPLGASTAKEHVRGMLVGGRHCGPVGVSVTIARNRVHRIPY